MNPKPIICNWCKQPQPQPCQNALEYTKCTKRGDPEERK